MKSVQSRLDHGWDQVPESPAAMQHHLQAILVAQVGKLFQVGQDKAVKETCIQQGARIASKIVPDKAPPI